MLFSGLWAQAHTHTGGVGMHGEGDKSPIRVGHFYTFLAIINEVSDQKINKGVDDLAVLWTTVA